MTQNSLLNFFLIALTLISINFNSTVKLTWKQLEMIGMSLLEMQVGRKSPWMDGRRGNKGKCRSAAWKWTWRINENVPSFLADLVVVRPDKALNDVHRSSRAARERSCRLPKPMTIQSGPFLRPHVLSTCKWAGAFFRWKKTRHSADGWLTAAAIIRSEAILLSRAPWRQLDDSISNFFWEQNVTSDEPVGEWSRCPSKSGCLLSAGARWSIDLWRWPETAISLSAASTWLRRLRTAEEGAADSARPPNLGASSPFHLSSAGHYIQPLIC